MDKLSEQFQKLLRETDNTGNQRGKSYDWTTGSRGVEKTKHILILQASDWNYQNPVITTISILTSGYDH